MQKQFQLVVEAEHAKLRLEDYLLDRFSTVSKMYLREIVKTELCEVKGRTENIGYRLRPNDFVEIELDTTRGASMRPENIPLEILHEDSDVIVVDKPAGMLMHPSHRENSGTLLNALAFHLNQVNGPVTRPGLPHRLDKQTSGLVVIAKNPRAHRVVSAQFMKKRVEKRYLALVDGVVTREGGTIDAPIGRYAEQKLWSIKADGKNAVSRFWTLERFSNTTLLEMEPVTGRTNQLRIHCEAIGHPIVGDAARNGTPCERLCLHAHGISFAHPSTGERLTFSSAVSFSQFSR